jgi:glycosyltransferase involved in cell wall biosynthesis
VTGGSERRLRVVVLAFDFAEVCVPIANGLSSMADVALVLPERLVAPLRADLVPEVHLETFALPRLRQPVRQLQMCRMIVRAIKRFQPDVLHLQEGHLWFSLALPLLRPGAFVVTIHDVTHHPGDRVSQRTPQRALDSAWRRADHVIVHADSVKQAVIERLHRDATQVHVVPHVAVGLLPERSSAAGDGRTVLFFGRIWPYKGLDHLIRAQPMITRCFPDARIVIAGRGENLSRYRGMMSDPSRFVVINEFVSVERRNQLFAEASVVVLPYVEASQSGVVPIAYAFEKPVVVTEVGGLPEVVADGRTGLVVPPGDEQALADAVCRLLGDAALARAMGAAGRRKLELESSPAAVAEQTMRVYELACQDVGMSVSLATPSWNSSAIRPR